jgi:hypothetical protein
MRQGVRMCRYPIVIWNKTCGQADGDANGGCCQITSTPWCVGINGFVDFSRVIVIEAEQGNTRQADKDLCVRDFGKYNQRTECAEQTGQQGKSALF